jgi:hypothetical protein
MTKKINYLIIICLIFSFFWKPDTSMFLKEENSQCAINAHEGSCSIITCAVGDEVLYGYNHDGHEYLEPYIVFGDHLVFSDGEIYEFGKPMCHTGRMLPEGPRDGYARLTTDGLCSAYNSLPNIPMYLDPQKENYSDSLDGYGPIYECSTVEEVIAFYNQYNYFDPPNPQWSWQSQWADAEGNAIVVGLNKVGNVTVTEMNESQYIISTNSNVAYPESCDGPCSDSTWRIDTATEMLQTIVEEESLTVHAIRDVLEAISVDSTLHSLIFNPKTLEIFAYYRHDFSKVFRFNLEEELSKLSTGEYKLYNLKEMYDNNIGSAGTFVVIGVVCVALAIIIIKTKRTILEA